MRHDSRIELLSEAAARLEADGLCARHLDAEIARLSAANDPLPQPANDTADGEVA